MRNFKTECYKQYHIRPRAIAYSISLMPPDNLLINIILHILEDTQQQVYKAPFSIVD